MCPHACTCPAVVPPAQGYALFKHMTVADNITFGPRMRKMDIDLETR